MIGLVFNPPSPLSTILFESPAYIRVCIYIFIALWLRQTHARSASDPSASSEEACMLADMELCLYNSLVNNQGRA